MAEVIKYQIAGLSSIKFLNIRAASAALRSFKCGNPESKPTYGHTFWDHGQKLKPQQLIDPLCDVNTGARAECEACVLEPDAGDPGECGCAAVPLPERPIRVYRRSCATADRRVVQEVHHGWTG